MTSQYVSRWAFKDGASPTFDGTSDVWDFNPGSDLIKTQTYANAQGLMGSRKKDVSRSRFAPYTVGGSLSIEPSPAFMSVWLPRTMGGGTATSPVFADAAVIFGGLQDRSSDVYRYLGLSVNRMTISGRAGGLIECAMDVVGYSETIGQTWAGTIPALGSTTAYEPFQFADCVLTAFGSAQTVLDFRLTIENNFSKRHANSLVAARTVAGDRVVSFEATLVYDDTIVTDVYNSTALTKNGDAGTLAITNGAVSTTFSFAKLQVPENSPRMQNGEIVLPVRAQIRGASLGAEMTVTNDITP